MLGDEALNANQVAEILHIGRNSVYALAKSGQLPSYKIGRKLLFALGDVQEYLKRQRREAILPTEPSTPAPSLASESTPAGIASIRPLAAMRATDFDSPTAGCSPSGNTAPISDAPSPDSFVMAGHGIAVDMFVERLEMMGLPATRRSCTSYEGLAGIYAGTVDVAFVRLFDQRTNSYNVPYVQRLAPGTPVTVFRLLKRCQGFAVQPGNPQNLSSWRALLREGVVLANRPRGCGSRVLLDEKMVAMEADAATIAGYQSPFDTGLAAINAVTAGAANAAVVSEHLAAYSDSIEFVPLQHEWLDMVVAKRGRGRQLTRQLKHIMADPSFCREYARIVHGQADNFGSIVYEC